MIEVIIGLGSLIGLGFVIYGIYILRREDEQDDLDGADYCASGYVDDTKDEVDEYFEDKYKQQEQFRD